MALLDITRVLDEARKVSIQNLLLSSVLAVSVWVLIEAVYRRYFHPLAKVPGPFLPAVTRLYLWYYSIVQEGQSYRMIERLHKTYGPIVRIAPNEIHLSEPDDYDKIYSVGTPFTKDPVFYGALGLDNGFSTISNELHRRRRAPLNNFFSRRAVLELEDLVQATARKICDRVASACDAGEPIDLGAAMRALSVDVITMYAFDESWNQLDKSDLGAGPAGWSEMVRTLSSMMLHFQQWPLLQKLILALPESVGASMDPSIALMQSTVKKVRDDVIEVQESMAAGATPRRQTILHTLLDTDRSTHGMPLIEYCSNEVFALLTAAADTTGNAMGLAAFNIVTHPDIYVKLRRELLDAFPDLNEEMPFPKLEKLPYLTGVVKEGLRLSYGVITRLARATPEGGMTFQGHFIPKDTTVSMSSWILHRREDVFPNPDVFDPTRWIGPPEKLTAQEHCLVSFSRGSRSCIGQNLAMCEMYVTLATVFRKFENLRAYDCGPEDLVYVEAFTAFHPKKARAFRVVVAAEA